MRPTVRVVAVLVLLSLAPVGLANEGGAPDSASGGAAPPCPDGTTRVVHSDGSVTCHYPPNFSCADGSAPTLDAEGNWRCPEWGSWTGSPQHGPQTCWDGSTATQQANGAYVCPDRPPSCPEGWTMSAVASDGSYTCYAPSENNSRCPAGESYVVEASGWEGCRPDGWMPPCWDGSAPVPREPKEGDEGTVYICPPHASSTSCPEGYALRETENGQGCVATGPVECPEGFRSVEDPTHGWICRGPLVCLNGAVLVVYEDGEEACESPCEVGWPLVLGDPPMYVCPADATALRFDVCAEGVEGACVPAPKEIPYCDAATPAETPCIPPPAFVDGEYLTPAEACLAALGAAPAAPEAGAKPCADAWFAPLPAEADETALLAWKEHLEELAPDDAVAALAHIEDAWSSVDDDALVKLKALAAAGSLFGVAAFDGETLDGSFLDATFDETGLGVRDLAFDGVVFFDAILPAIQGSEPQDAAFSTARGASLFAGNARVLLETHDNDDGATVYRTLGEPYDVTLDLAEGAVVSEEDGLLFIEVGDARVAIIAGAHRLDGSTLTVTVTADAPLSLLAADADPFALDLLGAIAEGEVGAELSLVASDAGAIHDLVSYDGVRVGVRELADDALTFDVGREDPDGSAVVFTFARSALDADGDEVRVLVDGQEIAFFDAVEDVTVGAADGMTGFFATADESVVRVVVRFSHFSDHTVRIDGGRVAPTPPTASATPSVPPPSPTANADGASGDAAPAPTPTTAEGAPATAKTPPAPVALLLVAVAALALARRRA